MRTRPRTTHLDSLRTFTEIRRCFLSETMCFLMGKRAIVCRRVDAAARRPGELTRCVFRQV